MITYIILLNHVIYFNKIMSNFHFIKSDLVSPKIFCFCKCCENNDFISADVATNICCNKHMRLTTETSEK